MDEQMLVKAACTQLTRHLGVPEGLDWTYDDIAHGRAAAGILDGWRTAAILHMARKDRGMSAPAEAPTARD